MQDSAIIWLNNLAQPPANCSLKQWEWLTYPDSLTERLRQITGNETHIELLTRAWGTAFPEELKLLSQERNDTVWIREIVHYHRQEAWIWARAVIPALTLQKTRLNGATTQSIGDILFTDPELKRTGLAMTQLAHHHSYHQGCAAFLGGDKESPWARRSILWFQQLPLLVVEVFLPTFFRSIHDC